MFDVGRLVVKIAGRDAARKGVVIEILDDGFVMIDGEVRRRKCNTLHLEPLDKVFELKDGSHEEIVELFRKELSIELPEKKQKVKAEQPKKAPAKKVASEKATKPKKASVKKVKKD